MAKRGERCSKIRRRKFDVEAKCEAMFRTVKRSITFPNINRQTDGLSGAGFLSVIAVLRGLLIQNGLALRDGFSQVSDGKVAFSLEPHGEDAKLVDGKQRDTRRFDVGRNALMQATSRLGRMNRDRSVFVEHRLEFALHLLSQQWRFF